MKQHLSPPFLSTRRFLKTSSRIGKIPLCFGLTVLMSPMMAQAVDLGNHTTNSAAVAGEHHFNIGQQALYSALNALAEQAGVQFVFTEDMVKGLSSPGVNGSMSTEQALQRVLQGTGLEFRIRNGNIVVLEARPKNGKTRRPDTSSLPAVKVIGKAVNDVHDPYYKGYTVPNATTGTKTNTPIMETPLSIQVVPHQVLKDQQSTDILGPLNRTVSGVLVRTGGDFLYDNAIIRGFSTNGFGSFYRNGLLNRQNIYEPANIEQFEVLKGPSSVLYGRMEPGGMINYVTKRPLDTPYYALQQQFGSYDLYRTTFDATGPIDKDHHFLYRINGAYLDRKSFRDYVEQDRIFIAPVLTWRPSEAFEANLELEYKKESNVLDSGIPAIGSRPAPVPASRFLGDSSTPNKIENVLIGLDWTYRFNDSWKLTNRFQWQDWDLDSYNIANTSLQADNRTLNRRLTQSNLVNIETIALNLDLTGRFNLFDTEHDVLVGFDHFNSTRNTLAGLFFGAASAPFIPPIDIFNPRYGQVNEAAVRRSPRNGFFLGKHDQYGIYFQDQITIAKRLHILGGGRYDWIEQAVGFDIGGPEGAMRKADDSTSYTAFTPRVGILFDIFPWLSVYGSYSESFGEPNGFSATGAQFDPQSGEQYEVGLKFQSSDKRLSATLAFYDLTKTNILTPDPSNSGFSILAGKARSQGVEFDMQGQITDDFNLILTYAYTDAKFTKDNAGLQGNRLDNVPRHQANLWGTYDVNEHLKIGLGGTLVDERQGDPQNSVTLPGYGRMDAMVSYTQKLEKNRLTAQLNVTNLLDDDYYSSSAGVRNQIYPGAPRTFLGSVKFEY